MLGWLLILPAFMSPEKMTLGAWAPDSVALIDWNVSFVGRDRRAQLTYELHGHQGWGLASLNFAGRPDGYRLVGLNVTPEPGSQAELNAFGLGGRGLIHYLILIATIASVLFSFSTAVRVWRTPMPRRRLFAFLSLVGFGTISLNWTTGQWWVQPTHFVLFGGAFLRAGIVGPWILTCGLPLGACIGLWRRAEYRRALQLRPTDSPSAAPV